MQRSRRLPFLGTCFVALVLTGSIPPKAWAQPVGTDVSDPLAVIAAAHRSVVRVAVKHGPHDNGRTNIEFGTGVLIHPTGYVLTCAHIVRDGTDGLVRFHSGEERPATVIARIPQSDLALLKTVPPESAVAARFRTCRDAVIGEDVFLIGNLSNTGLAAVRGNLAATGRTMRSDFTHVPDTLLLHLPITKGASGGPVFDNSGQVIGIFFAAIFEQPTSLAATFTHAISVPTITRSVSTVLSLESSFGLAAGLQVTETKSGTRIDSVVPGSPAAEADLRGGDIVVAVDRWDVETMIDFALSCYAWAEEDASRPLQLTIDRAGEKSTQSLTLTRESPEPIPIADMANAKPGCQLVVAELDGAGSEGPGLLRAWTRSLDGVWTRFGEPKQPQRTTWTGNLQVPFDGAYTFYLATPASGQFMLAGETLAEKTVDYPTMRVAGRKYLRAGTHPFVLSMTGGQPPSRPSLDVEGPGIPLQPVPDHWLWTD